MNKLFCIKYPKICFLNPNSRLSELRIRNKILPRWIATSKVGWSAIFLTYCSPNLRFNFLKKIFPIRLLFHSVHHFELLLNYYRTNFFSGPTSSCLLSIHGFLKHETYSLNKGLSAFHISRYGHLCDICRMCC